jgi:aspartate aminotransferase-like enzyme
MAAANVHHRTADFKALFQKVLAELKTFIGTQNDVILLASSGTGAMEASVANLTKPGDKVLVVTAGKFGERWSGLAKTYGCAVEEVTAPYGERPSLEAIRQKLTPEVRCVYIQATESSTGVRHDIQGVSGLVKELNAKGGNALLVVDAITGLGTTRLDVDGWGIDIIIGGSQKALMIPPGLAYMAVSERAWQRMEEPHSPAYYFDLRKERKSAAKGESAYTPAIALIAALSAALDYLRQTGNGDLAAGRDALIHNAEVSAAMTRAAAQALGLKLYTDFPADALTAIVPPNGLDSGVIVKEFRNRFDAVVANGQGSMKGQMFRVAHIGYFDYLDTIGIIAALEHVMAKVAGPVEFGTALKAAQDVFAKASAEAKGQIA